MDDVDLLHRYATTRSDDAFTELVRRHLPLVYSAALRRLGGDTHGAQDVAQRVFAELARQAAGLIGHGALEGWLYTTTRNVALHAVRTEQRRAARERAALMNSDPDAPVLDLAVLRPVIDGALDRLNARDREVVLLRFFRDFGFGEIGRRLGVSEDAARFRLNRALDRLRDILRKQGITSTPAALATVLADRAQAAGTDALVHAVAAGALAKASAGGSASALAHAVQLMSSTKAAAVAAVVIAGIGAISVQREYAGLTTVRTELAARTRDYQRAAQQLAQARSEQRASAPATTIAAVASAPSVPAQPDGAVTSSTRPLAAARSSGSSDHGPNADAAVNWKLSGDPTVRALLSQWMKSVFSTHAAFFRTANLSPDQIDRLEDLFLEYNINMGSAVLTLRPPGKPIAQVDAEVRQVMGEDAYAQYAAYAKKQFVEAVTIGLAGFVYDTDSPLLPSQAEQLTQIFFESSANAKNGSAPFPKDIDWSLALPRAHQILTPTQYQALKEVAVVAMNSPAAINPALPNTYGDAMTPPAVLFTIGGH